MTPMTNAISQPFVEAKGPRTGSKKVSAALGTPTRQECTATTSFRNLKRERIPRKGGGVSEEGCMTHRRTKESAVFLDPGIRRGDIPIDGKTGRPPARY